MDQGCERSVVPTDPLLAGLAVGTSAAFNSTQAQEGDPGWAWLDNPPSVIRAQVHLQTAIWDVSGQAVIAPEVGKGREERDCTEIDGQVSKATFV